MSNDPFVSILTQAAVQMHELYEAFKDAGFTDEQAFRLVQSQMVASAKNSGGDA